MFLFLFGLTFAVGALELWQTNPLLQTLLYLLLPLYMYATLWQRSVKKELKFDSTLLKLLCVFLLILGFTNLFSQNHVITWPAFFLTVTLLPLALFALQNKLKLQSALLPFILVISSLAIFVSVALQYPFLKNILGAHFQSGYNLVFPTYAYHNHVGDLLTFAAVMAIAQIFIYLKNKFNLQLLALLLLFVSVSLPFIFASYSRSALNSLFLSLLLLAVLNIKKGGVKIKVVLLLIVSVALLSLGSVLLFTRETRALPLRLVEKSFLVLRIKTVAKTVFNSRDETFTQALAAIKTKPFFGVGQGNFILVSKKLSLKPYTWNETALNYFLETGAENGLLVLGSLIALIVYLIYRAEKHSPYFYGAVALFVNFQTDYTYRIYPLWLLFFFLLFLSQKPSRHETAIPKYAAVKSFLVLGLLWQAIFWSLVSFRLGKYSLSTFFYPLNSSASEHQTVENLLQDKDNQARQSLAWLNKTQPGEPTRQFLNGQMYLGLHDKTMALQSLEKAYVAHPFEALDLYRQIYELKKELYGKSEAKAFLKTYQNKVAQISISANHRQEILENLKQFKQQNP
jgi:O-antigen ligase